MNYQKLFTNKEQTQRLYDAGLESFDCDYYSNSYGFAFSIDRLLYLIPNRISMRMTHYCPMEKDLGDWAVLPHPITVEDCMMTISKCDGAFIVNTFIFEYDSILPGQCPTSPSLIEAVVRFMELLLINGVKMQDIRNDPDIKEQIKDKWHSEASEKNRLEIE